jgi:hypothetical protein
VDGLLGYLLPVIEEVVPFILKLNIITLMKILGLA